MRDRFIPAFITLIAGAITCIIDIYRKAELIPSLRRLLFVIIIFYILGLISRAIIRKVLEPGPNTSNEYENEEIEETEEESKEESKEESEDNSEDITKD
jgi:flagellar biosynthesis/type III secretory pathway M-ring protein FliF/YscJ